MASLATIADLEARLGATVTDEARAQALLDDASALVRSFCRQAFDYIEGDEVTLRPVGMRLRLPQRPVTEVTSVVMVGCPQDNIPDLSVPGWRWDGIDIVDLSGLDPATWVELPEWWGDWWRTANPTYRVIYNHGWAAVPAEVVAVVCGMALRPLTSPTMAEGLTGEALGQYSWQGLQSGTGSMGATVRLTATDKQTLIDAGYRRQVTTIATPIG